MNHSYEDTPRLIRATGRYFCPVPLTPINITIAIIQLVRNMSKRIEKNKVIEARETLWAIYLVNHDERLGEAIKACNRYIRGEA